jgi:exodeoxyribonuclease V alpha subunit|tara:strand:+ start:3325 stop:4599 length:1275 start_codon:yes stop_codon:yes gene_type:complete
MDYDPKQMEAIAASCNLSNKTVAVTGKAGTGKTQLLQENFRQLTSAGYSVALVAPTGKAARRIKEATGINANTMHKKLEFTHPGDRHPKTGKPMGYSRPKRDMDNTLDEDVILADEYAMVNNQLHRDLFDALKSGAVIRVFGDVNQLRPIENAQILRERPSPFQHLLHNFTSVTLEQVHRQSEGSGIIEAGSAILKGRVPRRSDDVSINYTKLALDALKRYVFDKGEEGIDFAGVDNQIITPTKMGWTGTAKLNNVLQGMFRSDIPSDQFIEVPRHTWVKTSMRACVGDKIINTENIYQTDDSPLECFNGEVGIVVAIHKDIGVIDIDMGDRVVSFPPVITFTTNKGEQKQFDPRRALDLGYALTTHKTQGSEYIQSVYVLNSSQPRILQNRANFYTGLTRAREHAHIIMDQISMQRALNNKGE